MITRIGALFTLAVLASSVWHQPARADEIEVLADADQHQPVFLTPAAVEQAMNDPHAEVREVSEEEAIAAAAVRGVTLAPAPRGGSDFGHPWVIIKTGIGMPANIAADIEIYVSRHWTVGMTAGTGLGADVYMGSIRWRPDATCWGCKGKNLLSLGFGIDAGVASAPSQKDILLMASVDAMYIHRFSRHFGWVLGLKAGAGPTQPFPSLTAPPPPPGGIEPPPAPTPPPGATVTGSGSGPHAELGLELLIYTGFSF